MSRVFVKPLEPSGSMSSTEKLPCVSENFMINHMSGSKSGANVRLKEKDWDGSLMILKDAVKLA
jgi:hypothetical protein